MTKTLTMLILVALSTALAAPALAGKKKGEDAAPAPAPAEAKEGKKKHKEAAPADPAPAAPADPGKGALKPGQGVGRRICLGSTSGVGNIEVTSAKTVGVATCNGELRRVFLEKGICKGHKSRDKVEYGWQFADTTGTDTVSCP
jgi:hypothetical protein